MQRELAILDVSILDDALAEEHHRHHQFEGDTKLRISGLRPGRKYVVASYRPHPARFYPIDLQSAELIERRAALGHGQKLERARSLDSLTGIVARALGIWGAMAGAESVQDKAK